MYQPIKKRQFTSFFPIGWFEEEGSGHYQQKTSSHMRWTVKWFCLFYASNTTKNSLYKLIFTMDWKDSIYKEPKVIVLQPICGKLRWTLFGHTCMKGVLIYLKVFHFKTNLRYENCDRPTVKSSVEIIP